MSFSHARFLPDALTSAINCTLQPVLTCGEKPHRSFSRITVPFLPDCHYSSPDFAHMYQYRETEPVFQGQRKGRAENIEKS